MMARELTFLKVQQQLVRMCELMEQAGREHWRMDEIERRLMPELMQMGLEFLREHVESQGDGDVGGQVALESRTLIRSQEPHPRRYVSIFGEMWILRYLYALREGQKAEYVPLDARLGLPAGDNSYVLEEWQQRLCVKDAFGQSVKDLKAILGHGVSMRTAEGMNRKMAEYAETYRQTQPVPPAEDEGELVVVTADGKGVIMRRPLAEELRGACEASVSTVGRSTAKLPRPPQTRRVSSENPAHAGPKRRNGKKQMAYVGAVYTIDRFPRTADDVLDEMARRARRKDRPLPQHKRVWAEMTRIVEGEPVSGREWLFYGLAQERHQRDPQRQKTLICLLDGERSLWDMQRYWFSRAVGILDIFHVSERIWGVAHCFHAKDSRAASEFATHQLRMILDGKVAYVVRNLRRWLRELPPRSPKHTTVTDAITYFENNKDHMRYDEYLAAGYPIGSGVAEGACRHLVKDRMELTGMRWERKGAQSMLHLRAIYLNGEWDHFVDHRVRTEQAAIYGTGTVYDKLRELRKAA